MNGRTFFRLSKPVLMLLYIFFLLFPKSLIQWFWRITDLLPDFFGVAFRFAMLKRLCNVVGDNVYVARCVVLKNLTDVSIGSNVSFHEFCYIDGFGGIVIGDDVSVAHGTSIISFEHTWSDKTLPIKYNSLMGKKISISNDVWIGCGVRVLAGVEIGRRSIVAAGSVVKQSVPENTIVAGVPAKPVKSI